MMYLTRAKLRLGPGQSGAVAKLLADASERDAGHALIWSLMSKDGPERDFLFRQTDLSPPSYLILSQRKPEDANGLWDLATKSFAPDIVVGERFSFSLRVSPAIRKHHKVPDANRPGKKTGAQVDVIMDAKIRAKREGRAFDYDEDAPRIAADWLSSRSQKGFDVDRETLRVSGYRQIEMAPDRPPPKGQKPSSKDGAGRTKRFSMLDFDGVLTVTDAALFAKALAEGVGGKRSYGCGLLLIRPV